MTAKLTIFKSMRTTRIFPTLMLILLAIGITDKFKIEILILSLILILGYSSAGIYNAIKDKDINSSKKSKIYSIILIIIALTISIPFPKILIASIFLLSLNIIYHTISRKKLLLDTTILSITHYFIPLFISLIILGTNKILSLKISLLTYSFFWLITPIKNLKNITNDEKLGYKSLPMLKGGRTITYLMFFSSLVLIISILILIHTKLSAIIIIIILYIIITILLTRKKEKTALLITRITFLIIIFSTIITITNNKTIQLLGINIILLFLIIEIGGKLIWKK